MSTCLRLGEIYFYSGQTFSKKALTNFRKWHIIEKNSKGCIMRDDFLDSIIADLELYHITDAKWCISNDFIAFNLRNEIKFETKGGDKHGF